MRLRLRNLATLGLVLALAACAGQGGGSVQSVTITQVPSPPELQVGTTLDLGVVVQATGGAWQAVDWSSDATSVATVDANGVVAGVATGTVTISATSRSTPPGTTT